MIDLIIAIGVVSIFIIILFIFIYILSKRTNFIIQNLFVDKMNEYDYLIEDKDKLLTNMDDRIVSLKKEISDYQDEINKLIENKSQLSNNEVFDYENIEKKADFLDNDSLENYKRIKMYFNKSKEEIIKKFINDNSVNSDNSYYSTLVKIRSYFTKSIIYQLICYKNNIQVDIIKELLSDDENRIVFDLLNVKKFDIYKFLSSIDKLIIENDNNIFIYIGTNEDFSYLGDNIKTIYDDKITEGLRIEYKGTIYDYSI